MNETYPMKYLPIDYSPRISLRIYLRRLLLLIMIININLLLYLLFNIKFGHIANLAIGIKLPLLLSIFLIVLIIFPILSLIKLRGRFKNKSRKTSLLVKVAAYKEALKEFRREEAPKKWANLHYELANALRDLGEIELNFHKRLTIFPSLSQLEACTYLQDAEAAYKKALREFTSEEVPQKWANAQSELASALAVTRRWGKAGVAGLLLATLGVLFTCMFLAWADLKYITLTYQISQAQETQKQYLELNRKLRKELSNLSSTFRLEKLAEKFGMGPPQPSQVIDVK